MTEKYKRIYREKNNSRGYMYVYFIETSPVWGPLRSLLGYSILNYIFYFTSLCVAHYARKYISVREREMRMKSRCYSTLMLSYYICVLLLIRLIYTRTFCPKDSHENKNKVNARRGL